MIFILKLLRRNMTKMVTERILLLIFLITTILLLSYSIIINDYCNYNETCLVFSIVIYNIIYSLFLISITHFFCLILNFFDMTFISIFVEIFFQINYVFKLLGNIFLLFSMLSKQYY